MPYDYDIVFITPEQGIEAALPAVPWPPDLSAAPVDLDPAHCHYDDVPELEFDGGCRYVTDGSDRAAVARFKGRVRSGGKSHAVLVDGNAFAVTFDEHYRGARAIEAIEACSDVLRRANKQSGR